MIIVIIKILAVKNWMNSFHIRKAWNLQIEHIDYRYEISQANFLQMSIYMN